MQHQALSGRYEARGGHPAVSAIVATARAQIAAVREYYRATRHDYRWLWSGRADRPMHFGYYDEIARAHRSALLNTNLTIAKLAEIGPGERVLDCGCGCGATSIWLERERQAAATGINVVRPQLRQAAAAARAAGCAAVRFAQADFACLPFADASFDAVIAVESLCHSGVKSVFYREAARVLKPGGRLVVAEYMRVRRPLPAQGERVLKEFVDGWAIPDLDTAAEHTRNARAAGFGTVEIHDYSDAVAPSLRRLYRIARNTYPLALAARWLGLRGDAHHGNVIASLRQWQAFRSGWWHYCLLVARTEPAGRSSRGRVLIY